LTFCAYGQTLYKSFIPSDFYAAFLDLLQPRFQPFLKTLSQEITTFDDQSFGFSLSDECTVELQFLFNIVPGKAEKGRCIENQVFESIVVQLKSRPQVSQLWFYIFFNAIAA